jgi:flagellar motor switch/type III secretory pathway protein FliN
MHKELRIELGRTWLKAEDAAQLDVGDVIELDALTDEPADVLADGRLVARGKPAVMDGQFCVCIWEAPDAAENTQPAETSRT